MSICNNFPEEGSVEGAFVIRDREAKTFDLYIGCWKRQGLKLSKFFAETLWHKWPENTPAQPVITLSDQQAQELLDDFWEQGLRPSLATTESDKRWWLIDTVEGGPYWVKAETLQEAESETGTWATGFSYLGHSIPASATSVPASVPDGDSATKDSA